MRLRGLQAIKSKGNPFAPPAAGQSGQQMVEFALTFTMLVALLMALVIMGWVFFTYATITNAAREGSRHLMAHPTLPKDQVAFSTADQETTWVVTNSISMLDWRQMTVNISPDVSQRVYGGYVMVELIYTLTLPQINLPLLQGQTLTIGGPFELQALSRRSLD